MLSGLLDSAKTYFYLPIDDDEDFEYGDDDLRPSSKHIGWQPEAPRDKSDFPISPPSSSSSTPSSSPPVTRPSSPNRHRKRLQKNPILEEILAENDLYKVLGVQHQFGALDKHSLRRAYLLRSKACHPDKLPENPHATCAFQKVSVAYDILSDTSKKKNYDLRTKSQRQQFDFFSTRPHAEDTLRSVLLGVFNDFLEGDLEIVRTFLRTLDDLNPSLRLGEDAIDSVLLTLQSIRQRALTCRTCIIALHSELSQLLELQSAFRKSSYFDIMSRSRLTIKLIKITIGLPLKVEEALISEARYQAGCTGEDGDDTAIILPRNVYLVIRGVVVVLERMEGVLS